MRWRCVFGFALAFSAILFLRGSDLRISAQEATGEKPLHHFYIDADLRVRGLYSHGYKSILKADQSGVFWVGQRARLGFGYEHENLGLYIQAEDARIWGDNGKSGSASGFSISQAYFFVNFGKGFGMKIGRQPLKYEDGRYIHNPGWNEASTTFDALLFNFRSADKKTKADLAGSFSNKSGSSILNPYTLQDYFKYWAIGYVSHKFVDDFRWSVLYSAHFNEEKIIKNGAETTNPDKLHGIHTLGTYFDICHDRRVSLSVSGYGQWGKNGDGSIQNGYVGAVDMRVQIIPQLSLNAGYDYNSKHFNKFMGSGHAFLGIMDFFGSTSGPTKGKTDLHQPYLSITAKPAENHNLAFAARYFLTTECYPTTGSRDLGVELSIVYKYKILKSLSLEAGWACHPGTSLLETLQNVPVGQGKFPTYAYICLEYKPVIFDSERHRKP